MLADLNDQVQILTNLMTAVNTEKHEMPEFEPYPRPHLKKVEKETPRLDDFAGNLINLFGPGIL